MDPATRPALVVTGASGGIGRAVAVEAAGSDHVTVLVARSAGGLAETASEIRARGHPVEMLALDLADPTAGDALDAFLAERGLYCDVLVNNAGYGLIGASVDLPREGQLGIVDLNMRAALDLTLRVLPGMRARRRGGVIMIGSVAGFLPGPNMAAYYASKAFLRSLSEALWEEVRRDGVTVTLVAPGPVATNFFARSGTSTLFRLLPRTTAEDVAKAAWTAFRKGKRLVVPGFVSKAIRIAMAVTPRPLALAVVRRLQKR